MGESLRLNIETEEGREKRTVNQRQHDKDGKGGSEWKSPKETQVKMKDERDEWYPLKREERRKQREKEGGQMTEIYRHVNQRN